MIAFGCKFHSTLNAYSCFEYNHNIRPNHSPIMMALQNMYYSNLHLNALLLPFSTIGLSLYIYGPFIMCSMVLRKRNWTERQRRWRRRISKCVEFNCVTNTMYIVAFMRETHRGYAVMIKVHIFIPSTPFGSIHSRPPMRPPPFPHLYHTFCTHSYRKGCILYSAHCTGSRIPSCNDASSCG